MNVRAAIGRRAIAALNKVSPNIVDRVRSFGRDELRIPALESRLVQAETALEAIRTELARLDADLDESRRLNLRAAELLDIVFSELASTSPGDHPTKNPKLADS